MKKLVYILFTLIPVFVFSQQDSSKYDNEVIEEVINVKEAEFPGGEEAMFKFLVKKIEYPITAIENSISGRVFVQFIVNTNGEISDVSILRGVHPSLDAEAVRVIKLMPKWKPATKDGVPAKVKMNLPIIFNLQ